MVGVAVACHRRFVEPEVAWAAAGGFEAFLHARLVRFFAALVWTRGMTLAREALQRALLRGLVAFVRWGI